MKLEETFRPDFDKSLLHPRYWPVWLGFGLLAFIVNILPYNMLFKLGRGIGAIAMKFAKRRVDVAKRNLELAFPDMEKEKRDAFVVENFKNTGMAIIETGIAWFWPDWRFARIIKEEDTSAIRQHAQNNQGALLCAVHALSLEVMCRAYASIGLPGYGVYRPHSNAAYNFIQNWGRTRGGNGIIDRSDLKRMIRMLKKGHRVFYLPDHDYGRKKSVFVPLFAVEKASTTTGTSILVKTSRCALVITSAFRNPNGKYEVIADQSIENNFPQDQTEAAAYMNHYVEKLIMRAPEQWMWLHKRYKTLPESSNEAPRYKSKKG